jgi:hypothetical protein
MQKVADKEVNCTEPCPSVRIPWVVTWCSTRIDSVNLEEQTMDSLLKERLSTVDLLTSLGQPILIFKTLFCGKIGFLPNGHVHVRARVSRANLCADINFWRNLFLTQTSIRLTKRMNLFVKVCHGRFHDILPKECSGSFPQLLWENMIGYTFRCLLKI